MHGLNADASNGDYAKNAAKLFMQAAGVYAHLRDHVAPRVAGALTSDLSPEGLNMIVELMQAQAQALYYAKCVETPAAKLTRGNEKKKSAICAKLAQRAIEMYESAADPTRRHALKPDGSLVALESGPVQRRLTVIVRLVDVRAGLDKRLDHRLVAFLSGHVQRGLA